MTRQVVRVVSWLVVLGVTALVMAAVVVPRLAGATPYTVLTGSMAPAYAPGALVVVRPVEIDEVRTGDVITYQLRSGEPAVATHRVVGIGWTAEGEKVLTTRGDANSVADAEPVRAVQLRGEVWYSLPWVGRLNVLLSPDQHQLLVRLAAGALFLYAGAVLLRGWRSRPAAASDRSPAPAPAASPARSSGPSAPAPDAPRRPHAGRHAAVGS
jgi:signal peptidase